MRQSSKPPAWIDYEEFGERFVAAAVTPARIEAAVAGMAGRGISIGPFSIGPSGLAGFVAEGNVGKPQIVRNDPHVTFEVGLPVSLHLTVTLGGRQFRLEAVVEIDLTLHARTADPLLIVIDIPRVRGRDVSFVVRAEAVGNAIDLLMDPIATLVQREVANRVNGMLADPAARRARVFDVEAIMNGVRSEHRALGQFNWIDYAEFGRRFFPRIVTAARVREVVEGLAGRNVQVGPLRAGPRRAATVDVRGAVRMPRLFERAGDPVQFELSIPVTLDITVAVLSDNRYRAEVEIPLVLVVRAADPLFVVIDAVPPDAQDIAVDLRAQTRRARVLGVLGGIRGQIAAQVARVVVTELADPSIRIIDVADRITAATG
ncbi:hypothetical protein [Nocardia vaccinii]|uniref:hypothetical protein n=1 Tax=Nocardia vaccinii TaxID=1822 RepID=UPI0008314514|nr:hypothetical protein [Nocardia vaccinii]